MDAQTISCNWWNIMRGSMIAPISAEGNSTRAMGTPLTRLLSDPQCINERPSGTGKPARRATRTRAQQHQDKQHGAQDQQYPQRRERHLRPDAADHGG